MYLIAPSIQVGSVIGAMREQLQRLARASKVA
jgi:hypothetical protein